MHALTSTVRRSARSASSSILIAGLLLAGCSQAGGSPVLAESPGAASPTGPQAATPGAEEPTAEPQIAEPPAASMAVEGGDPIVGELGSFTWMNGGSDSPRLRGQPFHAGSGELLMVTLADRVAVENWTASYVPPPGLPGATPIGLGDGPGEPIVFETPPIGQWSVSVDVWFAGGLGSAAYYWLVDVD